MKVAYLIDTDWIIDYLNDREPSASKIEGLRKEGVGVSKSAFVKSNSSTQSSTTIRQEQTQRPEVILPINHVGNKPLRRLNFPEKTIRRHW